MPRSRRTSISCMCGTRRPPCTWLMRTAVSPASPASRSSPAGRDTPTRSARCSRRSARNRRWCCFRGTPRRGSSAAADFRSCARPRWPRRSPRRRGRRRTRPRSAATSARRSASPRRGGQGRCMSACRPTCSMRGSRKAPSLWPQRNAAARTALSAAVADEIVSAIAAAKRPIIIAGPQLSNVAGRALLAKLEAATGAPAVIMESPRGIVDATLGAFPDLIARADLIVLLGKALDFTTKWAAGPAFDPDVRIIAIDPDEALVARAKKEKGGRLLIGAAADASAAAEAIAARAKRAPSPWLTEARAALDRRPAEWGSLVSSTPGRLHPAEVFRALRPFIERDPDTVLICDGGEFAQWGQSMLPLRRRIINGVTGSIGSALSFALAARMIERRARGVRGAGRRHHRLSHRRVRDRRAARIAVRRDPRQRRALERRERDPAPRLWREPDARLRAAAVALRSGGGGVRRPRRIRRQGGRPACGDRARARQAASHLAST